MGLENWDLFLSRPGPESFSFIFEFFLLTFFILTVLAIRRFQTKIRLSAINKFFLRVVQLRCHEILFPLASYYVQLNEKPREMLVTSLSNLPVYCFKVIFVQQLLIWTGVGVRWKFSKNAMLSSETPLLAAFNGEFIWQHIFIHMVINKAAQYRMIVVGCK